MLDVFAHGTVASDSEAGIDAESISFDVAMDNAESFNSMMAEFSLPTVLYFVKTEILPDKGVGLTIVASVNDTENFILDRKHTSELQSRI